jgi:hypothetical protein
MRGEGGFAHLLTQFLTDQLTLFQLGGHIMPTLLLPAPPPQIFDQYGVSDRARYVTTHSNRAGGTGVAGVAFATLIFGRYIHPIPIGGGEAESALLLLYY